MSECIELLREALQDEDFQPQFSERQHMTGPALRGTIERALCSAEKMEAAFENEKARMDWLEQNDPMSWEVADPDAWSPTGAVDGPDYPTLRAAIDAERLESDG